MSQKLAIAISGAVSFGSYQAGVIYAVVEAIAQHNDHPDTAANQRIEIDVVTGASAGALTACILVQKLMFEAEALRQPYANALYSPWVEDLDLSRLLNLPPNLPPNLRPVASSRSPLSADPLADIGYRYLLQRYASGHPTPRQRHPASADSIRLGIAMSNLNGVDYTAELTDFPELSNPASRRRQFTYSRHQDSLTYAVRDGEADDAAQVWQTLEQAARSSSGFPFAFRPLQIDRQGQDYAGAVSPEPYSFAYTEGGLFENAPLGLAKHLVDQIDADHQDHHNRFYLYVSPGAKRSAANLNIRADSATLLNTAAALAGAIFPQSRLQNWLDTSQINQNIRQFEQQAKELSDMLLKSPQLNADFSRTADSLLKVLYREGTPVEQRHWQSRDRDRLRQQFTEEYDRLVYGSTQTGSTQTGSTQTSLPQPEAPPSDSPINGDAVAGSWLKLVQALEKAQNLGSKDVMTVYAITADDLELAGEQLSALGGFLDQSFRESDYSLGRRKATEFLQQLQQLHRQGKSEGQLYLLDFEAGEATPALDPDLFSSTGGQVELSRLPRQTRVALKSQLIEHSGLIVESVERRTWVRWLLKISLKLFLGKKLDELLKLEDLQSGRINLVRPK